MYRCTDLLFRQSRYEVLWAAAVKAFDYRKKRAPTITGGVPDNLFVETDDSLKREESVVNRLVVKLGQGPDAVLGVSTSLIQLNAVRRTSARRLEPRRRPDSCHPDCRYR